MLIGKQWKIESDNLNIILSREITRKSRSGEKYKVWEVAGYYSSLPSALKGLVNFEVKGTGFKDFQTIVQNQEELFQLIDNLITMDINQKAKQG